MKECDNHPDNWNEAQKFQSIEKKLDGNDGPNLQEYVRSKVNVCAAE